MKTSTGIIAFVVFSIIWLGLGWLRWVPWATILIVYGLLVAAIVIVIILSRRSTDEGGSKKQVLTREQATQAAQRMLLLQYHDATEPRGTQGIRMIKRGTDTVPVFVGGFYGSTTKTLYHVILDLTSPETRNTVLAGEQQPDVLERAIVSLVTEPAPQTKVLERVIDPFGRNTLEKESSTPIAETEEEDI